MQLVKDNKLERFEAWMEAALARPSGARCVHHSWFVQLDATMRLPRPPSPLQLLCARTAVACVQLALC